ncbi:hypothetical protein PybrP1_001881 [[Pythium] brassicae (nom. inval.)]|nr:hypothetical protein PybrP1_001881 [[Pythium] brassicae (nom. inval.)]
MFPYSGTPATHSEWGAPFQHQQPFVGHHEYFADTGAFHRQLQHQQHGDRLAQHFEHQPQHNHVPQPPEDSFDGHRGLRQAPSAAGTLGFGGSGDDDGKARRKQQQQLEIQTALQKQIEEKNRQKLEAKRRQDEEDRREVERFEAEQRRAKLEEEKAKEAKRRKAEEELARAQQAAAALADHQKKAQQSQQQLVQQQAERRQEDRQSPVQAPFIDPAMLLRQYDEVREELMNQRQIVDQLRQAHAEIQQQQQRQQPPASVSSPSPTLKLVYFDGHVTAEQQSGESHSPSSRGNLSPLTMRRSDKRASRAEWLRAFEDEDDADSDSDEGESGASASLTGDELEAIFQRNVRRHEILLGFQSSSKVLAWTHLHQQLEANTADRRPSSLRQPQ